MTIDSNQNRSSMINNNGRNSRLRPIHLLLLLVCLAITFINGFLNTNEGLSKSSTKATTADDLHDKWKAEQQRIQQTPPPPYHHLEQQQCRHILDKLDATFDERRNRRVRKAATTRKNNKPPDQLQFFDLFEPEAICFTEERFGSLTRYDAFGDGPKFVCGIDYLRETTTTTPKQTKISHNNDNANNNHTNPCLVYNVGSNNEIDFEQAVSTFLPGCEIHTFDPTLTKPYIGNEYSTFHPWGIGEDDTKVTFRQNDQANSQNLKFVTKSFERIMFDLDHIGRRINILKIDCEGCEHTAMVPLFELIATNEIEIDQILIEVHNEPLWSGTLEARWKGIVNFFEAADKAKMRVYHKERNGWGAHGCCVEYAFVSEDFLRRSNAQIVCAGDDDSSTSN